MDLCFSSFCTCPFENLLEMNETRASTLFVQWTDCVFTTLSCELHAWAVIAVRESVTHPALCVWEVVTMSREWPRTGGGGQWDVELKCTGPGVSSSGFSAAAYCLCDLRKMTKIL